MTSSRKTKALNICWGVALPLLTLLTSISWYTASPPDTSNRKIESFLALTSSVGLLAAQSFGVYCAVGRKRSSARRLSTERCWLVL